MISPFLFIFCILDELNVTNLDVWERGLICISHHLAFSIEPGSYYTVINFVSYDTFDLISWRYLLLR